MSGPSDRGWRRSDIRDQKIYVASAMRARARRMPRRKAGVQTCVAMSINAQTEEHYWQTYNDLHSPCFSSQFYTTSTKPTNFSFTQCRPPPPKFIPAHRAISFNRPHLRLLPYYEERDQTPHRQHVYQRQKLLQHSFGLRNGRHLAKHIRCAAGCEWIGHGALSERVRVGTTTRTGCL